MTLILFKQFPLSNSEAFKNSFPNSITLRHELTQYIYYSIGIYYMTVEIHGSLEQAL